MIEQEQHKQFDFEDIQRYLSGAMSASERHELERAALQDPFLSDAIDGFELQGTAGFTTHQHEIAAAIQQTSSKATVVDMPAKNKWMRIAVLFVLIAGVGLLGYQFFKPGLTEQVAVNQNKVAEKPAQKQEESISNLPVTDTQNINTPLNNQLLLKNKEAENRNVKEAERANELLNTEEKDFEVAAESTRGYATDDSKFETLTPGKSKEISADNINLAKPSISVEESLQGKIAGVQVQTNDNAGFITMKANNPVLQQGVIKDVMGNPLPNVNIISADKKSAALSDMFGRFSLVSADTSKNVTVAAIGYSSRQVRLSGDTESNTIILEPAAGSLSEVVVTSLGISRKNKELNDSTEKMTPATQPVGGWESFHEYVRLRLGIDSIAYYDDYPGQQVTVEFNLDKDGKPVDVKILHAENQEKAAAIRRIIETGPRWANPEKRKKIKTTIPF